jgi:hypothetical protein
MRRSPEVTPKKQYNTFQSGVLSRRYISRRAPGTPIAFETMFIEMEKGSYDTKAFKYAVKIHLDDIPNEEARIKLMWDMYEFWIEGKIHSHLLKKIQGEESDKI